MKVYLGIDVGSISTNLALVTETGEVGDTLYLRTDGNPIAAVQQGLTQIKREEVIGVGTTGSARRLAGLVAGADVVKTEIIAHAVASQHLVPDVHTIFEIGGQDSKLIILRNGVVVDFAMNTICAAGCGAFLDHQANRLKVPIEEFGCLALSSGSPVNIAGRCTVFAESDMIHKQQMGHPREDIINGLCRAIVRNYLNNVGKGKEIEPPMMFQGGVAANAGVRRAFEEELGCEIAVPEHHAVMGAIGAALLAREARMNGTHFKGFEVSDVEFATESFTCDKCPNQCEVVTISEAGKALARWGSRCGRWDV